MKGDIEKRKRKKRMRTKLVKVIHHKFGSDDEIENKLKFYKKTKKKIKNENNEDQIGKHNTINLDWRRKLKIKKIRPTCKKYIYVKVELMDEIINK